MHHSEDYLLGGSHIHPRPIVCCWLWALCEWWLDPRICPRGCSACCCWQLKRWISEMSAAMWWRKNKQVFHYCVCDRCVCKLLLWISEQQCHHNLNNSSFCYLGPTAFCWYSAVFKCGIRNSRHTHTHHSPRKKSVVAAVFLLWHIRQAWWKAFCVRALCSQRSISPTRYSPLSFPSSLQNTPCSKHKAQSQPGCLCSEIILINRLSSLCFVTPLHRLYRTSGRSHHGVNRWWPFAAD